MPIYEYACSACGKAFEHLARTFSEREPACPKCGSEQVKKQFSAFSATVTSAVPSACSSCPASDGGCRSASSHGAGCGCCSH